jgi:hypothetical protein
VPAPSVRSFLSVLRALPGLEQRTAWAKSELLGMSPEEASRLLEAICGQSGHRKPLAREGMFVLAPLIASLAGSEWIVEMYRWAETLNLEGLGRLLGHECGAELEEPPLEHQPVPDYGAGHELTLGERRSLARRPTRAAFNQLLADPHPLVIRQLLINPFLTEDDLVRLATRRPALASVIREVTARPRWLGRARVRMSVLQNPSVPQPFTVPLLSMCSRSELRQVTRSTRVPTKLRETAAEYLRLAREPVEEG